MISKEELQRMYCDEGMSAPEIAKEISVSDSTIYRRMEKYGINSRTISESLLIKPCFIKKEELQQMYIDKEMSMYEIAKSIGVSYYAVFYMMKKYGIESRTISESKMIGIHMLSKEELQIMYHDKKMTSHEIAKSIGVSYVTINNWMKKYGIESRTISESMLRNTQILSKEELQQMYWNEEMTQKEIGESVGVSRSTIDNWMKKYGIESRIKSKRGGWIDGRSFKPYCNKFNNEFKEAVRERDDYTCQLCGCEQLLGGQKLDVHHIHYDKANCYPDVVVLCRSCNTNVNGDRNYWEQYFEDQLIGRGLLNWSVN